MSNQRIERPRRYLSADALIRLLRARFEAVPDRRRQSSTTYRIADTLAGALAMFSLKEPSLLAFSYSTSSTIVKPVRQASVLVG